MEVMVFVLRDSKRETIFLALQTPKAKEGATSCKESKSIFSGLGSAESSSLQQRQRRLQDHGKERKELLSKTISQV